MPTGFAIVRNVIQDTGRWFVRLVGGALVLALVAVTIAYVIARFYFWPRLDAMATEHVVSIEQRIGARVQWRELTTDWRGLRPSFELKGLVIGEGDRASSAERVAGTVALQSLLLGRLGLYDLRVDRPVVTVARDGDQWQLAAQGGGAGSRRRPSGGGSLVDVARWLGVVPELRMGQGSIRVVTPADHADEVRFDGVDVVLRSRGRLHDLRLDIARPDRFADRLSLQADLLRPRGRAVSDWRAWEGTLRLQGRNGDPGMLSARALAWFPMLAPAAGRWPWQRISGRVDPDLRIAFRQGMFEDGRLALQSDSLRVPVTPGGDRRADFAQVNVDLRWTRDKAASGSGSAGPRPGATAVDAAGPESPAAASTTPGNTTPGNTTPGSTTPGSTTPGSTTPGMVGAQVPAEPPARAWRFDIPVLVLRSPPGQAGADAVSIVAGDRGVVIDAAGALSSVTRIQADLAEATLAAPVDWAKAWLPALSRLDLLAGTARDASIDWTGDRGWRVAARVDRAAFALAPTEFERAFPLALRIPGGRDVDVQLQATPAGGKATLTNPKGGGQAWLTLGGVLAEPEFALNELEAQVGWTVLSSGDKSGAGLRLGLDFENVRFANADVAGHTRVRYVGNGDGGDGQLTIEGALDRAQARRVFRYLPQALPGPVHDWVRDAFESGQFEAVKFAVNGRLMAFPFRGSERPEGEFQLGGRFRDVLLRFAPGWPTIQQATGDFGFDRASLQVNGHSGTVGKSRVEGVTVTIADLGQAELMLKGSARGDAGDMVRFVNASPLAATGVGAVTRPLRADGPAQLRLAVNYPFVGSARLKVDGQIDLNGTQITFDPSQPTFADARGHLNFTAESLSFDRVTATLNGSPVEAHGRSADGSTRIEAQARLSADSLRRFVDNVLTRQLDGATDVRVSILLNDSGRTVRAESDLVGLGSRLPAPLMKAAAQARPFRFDWTPQPDAPRPTERIEATLDDDVRLIAERTAVEPGRPLLITRAAVALGRTAQLPARGLALLANLPRLDGDAWLAVFDGPMAPAPAPGSAKAASRTATAGTVSTATPGADHAIGPASLAAGVGLFADDFMAEPTQIALVADELRYGNRLYRKVTLDAARSGRIWNARLQSSEIVGTLQWEYGGPAGADGRLVGRFGRLAIPNPIEGTKPLPTDRDARMPALDITADSLSIGDARLGRLELIATNLRNPAPVWRLDRLNLNSPAAAFRAGGTFRESTELDYELRIDNAGKLLEQFGLKGVVLGGSGQMSGKVRWQSVPSNFDIPTLSGDVKLDVRDGQFLKVEPGAAKLIGVLNLQALPKWLSLDFTDLFARGFAFQELSGRVKIDSGIARTETLGMRGLEAVVQIKGEADLIRQTQDVHVTILPNLDAGLATLAFAAIINPAIGLGAFLAQSLLGKQLSRAFAHEIDVKGPWVDPQVIPKRRENPSDALPTGG